MNDLITTEKEKDVISPKYLKVLEKDLLVYTVRKVVSQLVFQYYSECNYLKYVESEIKEELLNSIRDNIKITLDDKTNTYTGKIIILPWQDAWNEMKEKESFFESKEFLLQLIRNLQTQNYILAKRLSELTERKQGEDHV